MATAGELSRATSISGLSIRIIMTLLISCLVGMVIPRPSLDESETQAILELELVSEGSGIAISNTDVLDVSRSPDESSIVGNGTNIELNEGNRSEERNTIPSWSSESTYTSFLLENDAATEEENAKSFDEYFKSIGIDYRISESIPLQLDVGQIIPSPFLIHFNKTSRKMNNYPRLIEIKEDHFVGYGQNVNRDFSLAQISDTTNEEFLIEDCKMDNGFPLKLCASDGNTYENLSHFYCVQHHDKNLHILWDGACNRTDWPTVRWSSSEEKMEVINPEEIVRFFT